VCGHDNASRHRTDCTKYAIGGTRELSEKYLPYLCSGIGLSVAINTMKLQKGLALQDILGAVHDALQELELSKQTRITILDLLATIEYRLSMGATEKIQVSAMVAGIKTAIDLGAK